MEIKNMATPIDLANDELLVKLATTSLNSKVQSKSLNRHRLKKF